jgi:hypothetical protein
MAPNVRLPPNSDYRDRATKRRQRVMGCRPAGARCEVQQSNSTPHVGNQIMCDVTNVALLSHSLLNSRERKVFQKDFCHHSLGFAIIPWGESRSLHCAFRKHTVYLLYTMASASEKPRLVPGFDLGEKGRAAGRNPQHPAHPRGRGGRMICLRDLLMAFNIHCCFAT